MTNPEKENRNTYALTKRTTPSRQNKKSSAEAMYRIYREREKEGDVNTETQKIPNRKKHPARRWGWWRETTHGTTGSESCSQDVRGT